MIYRFMDYVQKSLETRQILTKLEKIIQEQSSKAGTRHEEVFTREFLCPTIADYFYKTIRSELLLNDDEIKKGLGTEGFQNCPGFGFTPASQIKHLFTKSDIIKSEPPVSWFPEFDRQLPHFQACPDFAITKPLPFSVVGEVKYFKSGSPSKVIKELYDAARQALFYLGTFHSKYDAAMIVVADASKNHGFHKVLQSMNYRLMERFGAGTDIYLLTVRLQ